MGFFDLFKSKPTPSPASDVRSSQSSDPELRTSIYAIDEVEAAQFRGKHYTDWVPELDRLRREKRDDELLELLLGILDATDRHASVTGREPTPGYYKQAAILYRRSGRIAEEIEIIERWERACPPGFHPAPDGWSTVRKARARELLEKNSEGQRP